MPPNLEAARQTCDAYCKSQVPAFCKSPSAPIAYDLTGFFHQSETTASSVRMSSCEAFHVSSRLVTCVGNEGGVGGGVASGVNLGCCKPIDNWSTTVRSEKQLICRHDTVMGMNCAGPDGVHETVGPVYFIKSTACVAVEQSGRLQRTLPRDIQGAKESLSRQAKELQQFGQKVYQDVGQSVENIANDRSIVGQNLSRLNDSAMQAGGEFFGDFYESAQNIYNDPNVALTNLGKVKDAVGGYIDASIQDYTKPLTDLDNVTGNISTETAAQIADGQGLTALAEIGPKLAGFLFGGGAKSIAAMGSKLKSLGGRIVGGGAAAAESAAVGTAVQGANGVRIGPRFTYRGDGRQPDDIFKNGFSAKGSNADLYEHAVFNSDNPSALIPTSESYDVARGFGDNVYVVRPQNGIDVNDVLGGRSPFPRELEIAVPGRISPSDVRAVTSHSGRVSILNPNYKP